MPRCQENAYISLAYRLPEIVKQLEIANKLKALELKLKFHGYVEPAPAWVSEVDKILKD